MESRLLVDLLRDIGACQRCAASLPLGPRPVVVADARARLLIIGQAPGLRVHESGIPWNDASGQRLRDWMGLTAERFYDPQRVAIVPMGFCYPGRGRGGDRPPRPECAPLWHQALLAQMPSIRLTLLVGRYAQDYYLGSAAGRVSDAVRNSDPATGFFCLPHPSPRNNRWLQRHPWFEEQVVPRLRKEVAGCLA
ncbi:uracil-DNA glycosylase family protein [Aestuariirhabdus litorea]|uniref:Uracil-DNA glycosylase family protein n=1 Tax=Aestuariirhabdus litorea TaxID=2528527 RepID=A0A3P3VL02_9GAMM|nr:uracil-DNA glycosylase family protein [Aestuariirhabdus litorea]RRJ83405.1 uracil-DNA glycosylase family protein [Aestuariirhabdus litorea]RWW93566.1 uracil-DNA glycosylase family protein [Endozoicomonadaceae bacterium GTF-13]